MNGLYRGIAFGLIISAFLWFLIIEAVELFFLIPLWRIEK
jgi:hypothetical protein